MKQLVHTLIMTGVLAVMLLVSMTASGSTTTEDITPPSVLSLTYEPYWADTGDGPQTITVTAHITDNLTGVSRLWAHYSSETTPNQTAEIEMTATHRLSGTALDGVYQTTFVLPQHSAYGRWIATITCTRDFLGNQNCAVYLPPTDHQPYLPYHPDMDITYWFWNGYAPTYLPSLWKGK